MAEGSGSIQPKKRSDEADTLTHLNVIRVLKSFSPSNLGALALELGIPHNKIEEFKIDIQTYQDRKAKVIHYWLNNADECGRSWKELQRALYAINERKAGDQIESDYLVKLWKDPRKPDGWTVYIPRVRGNVKIVKAAPPNGLLGSPKPTEAYFRTVPTSRVHHDERWLREKMSEIRGKMWMFCRQVESHQTKFKVGYEARFGRIYWTLPEDYSGKTLPPSDVFKLKPRQIVPHIYCDVEEVFREKCHPPDPAHLRWHVDPLKFVVHGDAHKGIKYVAVLMEDKEGHYHLHNLYEETKRPPKARYDIIRSGSKYDIRIGDCFALVSQTEDERVRRIADDIARSTHRTANNELEIPLAGKDFRVVFLRFKKQQQHLCKSSNDWILAEYDVKTYDEDKLKADSSSAVLPSSFEPELVPFNWDPTKEIELWSKKIFPENYRLTYPSTAGYARPQATGSFRLKHQPSDSRVPATEWKTDELLEGFEQFMKEAISIADILESCPGE